MKTVAEGYLLYEVSMFFYDILEKTIPQGWRTDRELLGTGVEEGVIWGDGLVQHPDEGDDDTNIYLC